MIADLGSRLRFPSLDQHHADPHQFLGLELNPRAAAIAELVLWIGYLQLHFKTKGGVPGEPILQALIGRRRILSSATRRSSASKDPVLVWLDEDVDYDYLPVELHGSNGGRIIGLFRPRG